MVVASGEPDVDVGICLVVDETIFNRTFWYTDGDAVCSVVLELSDDGEFLEGDAGGFNGVFTGNGVTVKGTDMDFFIEETFLFARDHSGVGIAREVLLFGKPLQQADQVLCRMERGLIFEDGNVTLIHLSVPTLDRVAFFVSCREAVLLRLFDVLLHHLYLLVMTRSPFLILRNLIVRQLPVFTLNAKLLRDLPDTTQCPAMTLNGILDPVLAMLALKLSIHCIQRASEVTAGSSRLSRNNIPALNHDDFDPLCDELRKLSRCQ